MTFESFDGFNKNPMGGRSTNGANGGPFNTSFDPNVYAPVRFGMFKKPLAARFVDWIGLYLLPLYVLGDTFGFLAWFFLMANVVVLQGLTGASLGKRLFGLRLAWVPESYSAIEWTFVAPGIGRCLARYVLHFIDIAPCLWGLWRSFLNAHGQTWADFWAHTVVIDDNRVELISQADWRSSIRQRR